MDQGLTGAEKFIKENLLSDLARKATEPLKDFKSRLQEIVQAKGLVTPKYQVIEESGPDHNKKFIVEVLINGESWGKGEGKSKSAGEQAAARQALTKKVQ